MSSVFERNRDLSDVEWISTARKIRLEIDGIVRSEKVFFKSIKFSHANKLCDHAANLVHHVKDAYRWYPNTPKAVIKRKEFLKMAEEECWHIVEDVQNAVDGGMGISANRFDGLAVMLDTEIGLLHDKRKNTKLTGSATIEERIEKKEFELEDLRALVKYVEDEEEELAHSFN